MTVQLHQLPSLLVDSLYEDHLGATQAAVTSDPGPYDLSGSPVLTIDTDSAAGQTITMSGGDFDDPTSATAAEVVLVLNSALVGGTASVVDGAVVVTSDTYGTASEIQVAAGGANNGLGFFVSLEVGEDATAQAVLCNRIPTDGEVEVAADTEIEFCVFSSDGVAPAVADFDIVIGSVQAVASGVAEPGFSVVFSLLDSATRRVVLTPSAAFDSQALIEIDIEVASAGVGTYSFIVKDTTSPQVVSAAAQDVNVVRVTYNEPMLSAGVSQASTYNFARVSTFAVAVEAVSATVIDTYSVDVTTDIPLTFGASYTVTVTSAAEDIRGNSIDGAPNNQAAFTGFNPEVPAGRRFQLWDWIPEKNKREDHSRDLSTFISVLQEMTNIQLYEIDRMADLIDPDTAPEDVVDVMLLDLGNPFDVESLELEDKRRLIQVLVEVYRSKGTALGIISVVNFLMGINISIDTFTSTGWLLGVDILDDEATLGPSQQRELYSFEATSPTALTAAQRSRMTSIINYMKPAHEHLARIIEPSTPISVLVLNHVELGYSRLGINWRLH